VADDCRGSLLRDGADCLYRRRHPRRHQNATGVSRWTGWFNLWVALAIAPAGVVVFFKSTGLNPDATWHPNMVDNSFLNDHICGVGTSRICH
jgi:hypothetical protein